MAQYMIEAREVCKSFRRAQILKSVSMNVAQGEIAGLVGNNGSGKSVFLKCLCGLLIPTSGTIVVEGKQLGKNRRFSENMGAVIEAPGFIPQISGYDNLKALWSLSRRAPLAAVAESIRRVGLDPKDRKKVGKYSMGMRQRLGLAQAIMENPRILLLDEPFNGLDKNGLKEMYAFIESLKAEGITAIVASHNPGDIERLCDSVYEMDDGRLERVS